MRLNESQKLMVRRLALSEPEELDAQEQRLLCLYTCARNIHKKADKEARQIWRKAVCHTEKKHDQ
jgi:hypothetical protein